MNQCNHDFFETDRWTSLPSGSIHIRVMCAYCGQIRTLHPETGIVSIVRMRGEVKVERDEVVNGSGGNGA